MSEKELSEEVWSILEDVWPEYIKDDGKGNKTAIQHDAAEFMMKFIDKLEGECENSISNIQTIINRVVKCTNKNNGTSGC